MNRYRLLFVVIAMLFTVGIAQSQITNSGMEFFVSFPSNSEDTATAQQYIRLYMVSNDAATVKIWAGNVLKTTVTLTPRVYSKFDLTKIEAQPVTRSSNSPIPADAKYANKAIRVESDAPITLFGLNHAASTGDAMMVLPVHTLGREYVVATATENVVGFADYRAPAQYLVIGAFDGTVVTIKSADSTQGHSKDSTFTVTLNKGDVFSAMTGELGDDPTGTIISATKPVAVTAGNANAWLPDDRFRPGSHLCEMLLPLDRWGTSYHVLPFTGRTKGDMFRIVAGADSTTVSINGNPIGVIPSKGGGEGIGWMTYLPDPLNLPQPFVITADKPIAVYQYGNSMTYDGEPGDPFYTLLVPADQYQKQLLFSLPVNEYATSYINLICDSADYGNVEIAVGSAGPWQKVKNTFGASTIPFIQPVNGVSFVGKTIQVTNGESYRIRGSAGMVAYMYGYGVTDSYGTPATSGLGIAGSTDIEAPKANGTVNNCNGNVNGLIQDAPLFDPVVRTNLTAVWLDKNRSFNYTLQLDTMIIPGFLAQTTFKLRLIDTTKPGAAFMISLDGAGNMGLDSFKFALPKYAVSGFDTTGATIRVGDTARTTVWFHNAGSLPVSNIQFALTQPKNYFRIVSPLGTVTVAAGDSVAVVVEFTKGTYTSNDTSRADLSAANGCTNVFLTTLRGMTSAPVINAGDGVYDAVPVGTNQVRTIVIRNTGTAPLTIMSSTGPFTSVFTISSLPPLPLTIPPSGQLGFDVKFQPDSALSYKDSIVFVHNGGYDVYKEVTYLSGAGSGPSGVTEERIVRSGCAVLPNPVSDKATLRYNLRTSGTVAITIVDAYGNTVKHLLQNGHNVAGMHTVEFRTEGMPAGAYFCRIVSDAQTVTVPFVVGTR